MALKIQRLSLFINFIITKVVLILTVLGVAKELMANNLFVLDFFFTATYTTYFSIINFVGAKTWIRLILTFLNYFLGKRAEILARKLCRVFYAYTFFIILDGRFQLSKIFNRHRFIDIVLIEIAFGSCRMVYG